MAGTRVGAYTTGGRQSAGIHMTVRFRVIALVVAGLVGAAAPVCASDLKLEIRDGLVTLTAKDVSARQILAEWARIGQTRVVNPEFIPSGPVTLQLSAMPERQALAIILRAASGFMAARRAIPVSAASQFDRILIVPARPAPVAATTAAAAPAQPSPAAGRPTRPPNAPPWVTRPGAAGAVSPDLNDDESADDPADESDDTGEDETPPSGVNPPLGLRQPGLPTPVPRGMNPQDPAGSGRPATGPQGTQPTLPGYPGATPGVAPIPGVAVPAPKVPPKPPGQPR